MSASVFVDLFDSDKRYRRWFRQWWEQDFSIRGRNSSLAGNRYFEKMEFGGRRWPREWMPPHDLDGKANPLFQPTLEADLHQYKWQSVNSIAGAFVGLKSIEAVSNLSTDMSWCAFLPPMRGSTRGQKIILESALILENFDVSLGGHGVNLNISKSLIFKSANIVMPSASIVDVSLACVDGNLTIRGETLSTTATNARVGGNCSLSGVVNARKIRTQDFTARQSSTRMGASNSVIIDHARVRDIEVAGGYEEINMRNVRAQEVKINCSNAKILLATGSIAKSFQINESIDRVIIDGINVDSLRLSKMKSKEISARSATISKDILVSEVDVRVLNVDNVTVKGNCLFEKSQFHDELSANRSIFEADASFGRCAFPGALRFQSSVFLGGANFRTGSGADVGNDVKYSQVGEADFSGTEFYPNRHEVCADFDARQFLEAANFEAARFEGVAKFFGCQFHEDTSFRGAEFKIIPPQLSYLQAVRALPWRKFASEWKFSKPRVTDLDERIGGALRELRAPLIIRRSDHNRRLSNYERSYNALRQRFEKVGNAKEERRFHTYELRARRQRIDANAPLLEGILSRAYDSVSVYGQSISRPLWVLVMFVWLAFSAIYYAMAWDFGFGQSVEAAVFSARQIVKPFSAWSRDFLLPASYTDAGSVVAASDWTKRLVGIGSESALAKTTIVRILASIQSVGGLILLFLSGLAVKRTFGVN